MSTNFVLKELSGLKVTKASGPDGITARRLKDAAPVIAKPITYLVNLTISTGLIPTEWKDARVTVTNALLRIALLRCMRTSLGGEAR